MHREAYIVGQKGIVRAAEKWGWQAGHFSITGNPKSLQTILRSFESCKHLQLLFTFAISLPNDLQTFTAVVSSSRSIQKPSLRFL